jgi:F0F1-type ATP synthase membrane subunit b/b'
MLTVLLILGVAIIGVFVATKFFGVFKDEDKNGVPDKIEEKIEVAKEVVVEVKQRAKKVKEEVKDVAKAAKEVVKQTKDVAKAATTKTGSRKGRKPKQ